MTYYLLHPKNGLNHERYNREYKYDAKDKIAKINPLLRIRFSTSNPQDMGIDVINIITGQMQSFEIQYTSTGVVVD